MDYPIRAESGKGRSAHIFNLNERAVASAAKIPSRTDTKEALSPAGAHGPAASAFAFLAVVDDLDDEDDHRADGGDGVGEYESPAGGHADVHANHDALDGEEQASQAKHDECREGDAVRLAGADGGDGLGQIAQHQADGGKGAKHAHPYFCCHNLLSFKGLNVLAAFALCGVIFQLHAEDDGRADG